MFLFVHKKQNGVVCVNSYYQLSRILQKTTIFFFYILPKIHQKSETATTFVKAQDQLLLMQFQHNYITYKQEVQKLNVCQCDGYWTDDILGLLGSSTISGIDPVVGKITKLNWIFMRTTHVFYINFTKHVLGDKHFESY